MEIFAHTVLMGVSGSGKTTVGHALSEATGVRYLDGDVLHSPEAVAKMGAGVPLTDADRWPWLGRVAEALTHPPVIVGCSALKRSYRDLLRGRAGDVLFVHLTGRPEVLAARVTHRSGHFMPPALLASQLADLQPPEADERSITVDIDQPLAALVAEIQVKARAEASR